MAYQRGEPSSAGNATLSRFGNSIIDAASHQMPLDRAYSAIFSREEAETMSAVQGAVEVLAARQRLVSANVPLHQSYYLTRGFVGRTRMDRSGRRQFLALQIPGDYVDLPAFVLERLDHDLFTISEVAVRATQHVDLTAIRDNQPDLLQKLWRVSMMDAAIHRYWIFRVGRLAGRARIANFFCEMLVRLYSRGLGTLNRYSLPLTQTEIAEACGITAVHANRLIGELRDAGTCDFSNGEVVVKDPAEMFKVGHFTWDYLYLPAEVDSDLRRLLGMRPARV